MATRKTTKRKRTKAAAGTPPPHVHQHDEEAKYIRLRRWNVSLGFLHLAQAVFMLLFSSDFSLPVTTSFLQYSAVMGKLAPVTDTVFSLRIGPLVAGFFFLSAIAHFAVSIGGGFGWYVAHLKRHINFARWIEYAFSSSLMIVVIGMLVGMYDGVSLILLFFLNAAMILFGWIMEAHNQHSEKTHWLSYWFGVLAGVVPWVVIAFYLFGAGGTGAKPPTFVYWIYFSIFVFFNTFAINMALQYKKVGNWRDYLYGEKTYLVLSLVAKTLLAWQVWAGTLRPV